MSFFQKFCLCFCVKSKDEKYVPPKMVYLTKIFPQQFPFPKPIMRYLIKNVNVKHIRKLQQTCRYFYLKFNYNIIDYLSIDQSEAVKISNFYVTIPDKKIEFLQNNLYLTKRLYINSRYNNLEKMFQKIVINEICELHLAYCNQFKISDFEILTKSKNLETVRIDIDIYFFDNTTIVPIEDILSYIPNVTTFFNSKCIFTSTTMQKLFALKRSTKFKWLWLEGISQFFDSHLFNNYMKEMFDFNNYPASRIELFGDHEKLEEIYELMKKWRPQSYFVEYNFLVIH